jgi:hypothetical protein
MIVQLNIKLKKFLFLIIMRLKNIDITYDKQKYQDYYLDNPFESFDIYFN